MDNYIWVILDDNSPTFSCIDPGDADPVYRFAQESNRTLTHILLTHHHHDHVGGVSQLMKTYPDCLVYGPEDSRIPQILVAKPLTVSTVFFEILQTPGHTSTHISYYATDPGWLFCGDTLFSAGCGRVFDGTMEQLHESLQYYKHLPDNTLVFCAHEYTRKNLQFSHTVEPKNVAIQHYLQKLSVNPDQCTLPSSIKLEKSFNPFLRTDKEDVQQFAITHGAPSAQSLDVFSALRHAKDIF
jgi:hydroxyacylglutathione hydrolase